VPANGTIGRRNVASVMLIGASTGALYPGMSTEDAVDRLAGIGFPILEVLLQTAGEYEAGFVHHLVGRVRYGGSRVHSVHTHTELHRLFDPYARRRAEGFDAFRRAIEAAALLGAGNLVWHGLTRADHQRGVGFDAFAEVLGQLAYEAADHGIEVCLENVAWCVVRDAESVTMVRGWGLPIGFTFDPFQAVDAGVGHGTVLRAMAGRLRNVHVSDAAPRGRRHLPPGEGEIDWPALLRLIRGAGYDGPLMIEGACDGDLDRLIRSRELLIAAGPTGGDSNLT